MPILPLTYTIMEKKKETVLNSVNQYICIMDCLDIRDSSSNPLNGQQL